jgi:hypothetical protein
VTVRPQTTADVQGLANGFQDRRLRPLGHPPASSSQVKSGPGCGVPIAARVWSAEPKSSARSSASPVAAPLICLVCLVVERPTGVVAACLRVQSLRIRCSISINWTSRCVTSSACSQGDARRTLPSPRPVRLCRSWGSLPRGDDDIPHMFSSRMLSFHDYRGL